jgi:hypothetical protein
MKDVMRRIKCVSDREITREGTDVKGKMICHEKDYVCDL